MSGLAVPAVIIASVTFFVGAVHLLIYTRRRSEPHHLTFALICFTFGGYNAIAVGVYRASSSEGLLGWLRLLMVVLSLNGILMAWFVSHYAGHRYRNAAIWISIAFLPPLLAAVANVESLLWSGEAAFETTRLPFGLEVRQHVVPGGPILSYQLLPLLADVGLALIAGRHLRATGKSGRGTVLLVSAAAFLAAGISDAAVFFGLFEFLSLYKFAFVAFILLMTWSLMREVLAADEMREALQESEERLSLALEGANEGLWDWSPATENVHFSPRWFTMIGYEPDELPHDFETWSNLLHADDRERSVNFAENFIVSGDEFFSLEFRMKQKTGGWRWILSRGKAVERNEKGHVLRMVGTHSDITPRKDAEAALALSEERFRSIVESSPMGMYVYQLEPDDRLVLVDGNEAADRFTGVESAALLGMTIEEAFPALAETEVPDIYRRAAREGVSWQTQDLFYEDGRIRGAFDVHAFQTTPGRMAVMFLDVTDRHRAADALRRSEAMYRSYFTLGLIGMAVLSPDGRWVEVNGRLCEILGRSAEELSNRSWVELTHPEDKEIDQGHLDRLLEGEVDDYSLEKRFLRKNGSVAYVDQSVTSVRREDGSVEFLITHIQDISERKLTEERLRQSQKMEAVGQLAGGVAHDFNNILQAIRGYTDVAIGQVAASHPARGNMIEVRKAADRAAALTRQLLTFSRRETLQPAWLDLNDVIADLLKMLRRVIGEQVELIVSSVPGLLPVFADPGQVEQVIMNLCINARDAMPDGGRLVIETENVQLDADFIKEHPWAGTGDYVRLRFTDSGEGIPQEIMDRIFEPFFTTKEVGEGTGLGLATVYAILERHEGGIEVQSLAGEGTIITAYFPSAAVPDDEMTPREVEQEPMGGTETILLAEDDEAVRRLVVSLLTDSGYQLLVAKDGQEAIDLFEHRSGEIDLALLDVIMPKRSGRDVYTTVKRIRPSVPVLFMSGYSFNALERGHLPDGRVPLIQKPYTPTDLLNQVRRTLDARSRGT